MSELTSNGKHETESEAGKWAQKFYRAFMRVTVEENIKGFDIGENFYQFHDGKQTVTIIFKTK